MLQEKKTGNPLVSDCSAVTLEKTDHFIEGLRKICNRFSNSFVCCRETLVIDTSLNLVSDAIAYSRKAYQTDEDKALENELNSIEDCIEN